METLLKILVSLLCGGLFYSLGLNWLAVGFLIRGLWLSIDPIISLTEAVYGHLKTMTDLPLENGQGNIENTVGGDSEANPHAPKEFNENDNRLHFTGFFNFSKDSFKYWFGKGKMGDSYGSTKGSWKSPNKNQPKPILSPQQKQALKRRENEKFVREQNYRR